MNITIYVYYYITVSFTNIKVKIRWKQNGCKTDVTDVNYTHSKIEKIKKTYKWQL